MPRSSVTLREIDAVTIVDLKGFIMLGESSALVRTTFQELINNDQRQIILNLREVSRIDSAGVGELVAAYILAKKRGGKVKLLNPSPKIYDMLKLTQLSKIFEIYADEALALRSYD
jgi:anti-sigma B factor antagonist